MYQIGGWYNGLERTEEKEQDNWSNTCLDILPYRNGSIGILGICWICSAALCFEVLVIEMEYVMINLPDTTIQTKEWLKWLRCEGAN